MGRIQGRLFHKFFSGNDSDLERLDDRPGRQDDSRRGGDLERPSQDAPASRIVPTTANLDPAVYEALATHAAARGLPVSEVIAEAVSHFLGSPGDAARRGPVEKRLDSVARSVARIERDQAACAEILGQFVKLWSAANPLRQQAARSIEDGHVPEQYEAFLDTVGRSLASGQTVSKDMANRTGFQKSRGD